MNQPTNSRISQKLYKLIITNLIVITGLFIVAAALWLVLFIEPQTESIDFYRPEAREEAVDYLLSHIKPVNNITNNLNAPSLKNNFLFLSNKCANADSDQRIVTLSNKINESLTELYDSKYLNNHYALQLQELTDSMCQSDIDMVSIKYGMKLLSDKKRLMQLNWSEKHNGFNIDDNPIGYVNIPKSWLVQSNPWFGLAGCIYIKDSNNNSASYVGDSKNEQVYQLCNNPQLTPPFLADNSISQDDKVDILSTQTKGYKLPPDLNKMYSELQNLHSRHFNKDLIDAYEAYHKKYDERGFLSKIIGSPVNSINIEGADVKIGYNIQLTLDPDTQSFAQRLAECMTTNVNNLTSQFCKTYMSEEMISSANKMYENSLVRSVGIAVIDVSDQSIMALASSHSDCYAYDNGENINIAGCPKLWKRDWSGERLLNHAVYQHASPGSIIKPAQALGIIRASSQLQNPNSASYKYLMRIMASSSTKKLSNFLFCYKTSSNYIVNRDSHGHCPTMEAFKQASLDMGWNANCTQPSPLCGYKDLLFGMPYQSEPMLQSKYFSGRLLTDSKQTYNDLDFSADSISSCIRANGGEFRGACAKGGENLNKAMNEVFGAGNATSTALGAADMFATLLNADNGSQHRRGAHLINEVWGVDQKLLRPKAWRGDADYATTDGLATLPNTISQKDAHLTVNLLYGTLEPTSGLGNGQGTAHLSCITAIKDCSKLYPYVVSKTGTPGFNFPTGNLRTQKVTTNMVEKQCQKDKPNAFLCSRRPYKWFIMGIKDKNTQQWSKAVAILVERNWQKDGTIDESNDGINRSAQIGSILAKHFLTE